MRIFVSWKRLALVALPVPLAAAPFAPPIQYRTGNVPELMALGDLDQDGILDVVVANTSASEDIVAGDVSVLLGLEGGGLRRLGEWRAGDRPEGLLLALIDRDPILDAVTANFDESSISVLLGDGTGGFRTPIVIPAPGGPRSVVAVDLDRDGYMDLATADYTGDSVTVWKGMGQGLFLPLPGIPAGNGPEVIATARVDGDELVDLVTANALDDSITAFVGRGNGTTFTPWPRHPVGDAPRFVLARDLDGDGFDDLIVANHFSGSISIERNLAGERFETVRRWTPAGLRRPIHVDAADLDADGCLDLLATWFESDAFTVFPGAGGLDSGDVMIVSTARKPVGIACADFDRDGDVDVLVTSTLEDRAVLHRSTLGGPHGPSLRTPDANGDGIMNLSDAISVLVYLHAGGAAPACTKSADMDDSRSLGMDDPIRFLNHLVLGGPEPPPPF